MCYGTEDVIEFSVDDQEERICFVIWVKGAGARVEEKHDDDDRAIGDDDSVRDCWQ